ncbi:MAG: nucleotidyltransferase domain-containing protein [Nanoarchaeota archaeon]|nr:nucleotidyltransferase domain-containing protein [Nanoarchaeota archaeon]MBU4301008.1 nucleotidyltransferase domain-containing protein [Nanoarchaeota archaeon]MBU4452459.1 nucleotidyltransferase domain-containing protein [Nanoarchaeota archaeon]MCG2723989.1 nucleotidyltransferase domain-containing protein [archaeon]
MGKGQVREIEWLLEKIKKKYPDAKILLFGSRARGDHLESSDYDLLILSDDFENVPFRKRLEEIYELVDRPANVEIICLTHKEFRERRNELSIIKEIAREGMVV